MTASTVPLRVALYLRVSTARLASFNEGKINPDMARDDQRRSMSMKVNAKSSPGPDG